jgi:alginate O-acetyltransferase complex protein AlgI
MIFNSFEFGAFFGIAYLLFQILPAKSRCWYLVIASYCFYSFVSIFACGLLLLVSLVSYFGGLKIAATESEPRRQWFWLVGSVCTLCAILSYFKGFNLIFNQLRIFLGEAQLGNLQFSALLLPLGLSYYIFQAVGYLVDVYWGKEREEKLGPFLLFMAFFPKLMMGPIERSNTFLPQIRKLGEYKFNYDNFREGGLLFAWGLFKKLAVAERLGLYVNEIYASPGDYVGIPVVLGAVFFTIQLYADFSGYTDMALGCARLFNIKLINNFSRPFCATNIQDFWRRWHISFSSWIADYVFTPLRMQFRTLGTFGLCCALLTTFLLLGIWHGTGWTFVVFGLFHGVFMTVSTTTLRVRDGFWKKKKQLNKVWLTFFRRVVTFGLVTFTMVFFRAASLSDALELFRGMLSLKHVSPLIRGTITAPDLIIILGVIGIMEIGEFLIHARTVLPRLLLHPWWTRWPAYAGLVLLILCLAVFSNPKAFIYFEF